MADVRQLGRTVRRMPRFVSQTPAFVEKLATATGGNAGLQAAVYAALGVPYGVALDPAEYVVLGWHLQVTAEELLAYVLTPGRFVRYQVVADQRSLTVAVPLARVCRVVEESSAERVKLTVELDADGLASDVEFMHETTSEGRTLGRALARTSRTQYTLEATTPEQAGDLVSFSVALRNALGS